MNQPLNTNISLFTDEAMRWQAMSARDPQADGCFVYAVKTTGIYCRPTCPSRRPKPENVEFFDNAQLAGQAGYRACQRCRPDPENMSLQQQQLKIIEHACQLIDSAEEPPALQTLADAAGLSRFHFHRLFKDIVGVTPKEYATARRVRRLQQDLQSATSVTDAIYEAGFGSSSRVYENADATLGMTPARYRSGGAGIDIYFSVAESALGWLLVAATGKGICSIELADDAESLRQRLQQRFARARLIEDGGRLQPWLQQVLEFIRAPQRGLDLPLDIRGTAFQRQVWKTLQTIPPGQTASYGEIAQKIGKPQAVRAVAQACAGNNIALVIPCHRVVRSDGSSGGYRWGNERKKQLLSREREEALSTPGRAPAVSSKV
jgi:AraC family transcriptional regulator of adaptative response/methylated-DNA-[protein]-cysteine methyltransferase